MTAIFKEQVYLIEAECGTVKIGCSRWPSNRLSCMTGHTPVPVRLIAQWAGDRSVEMALHNQFVGQRSHNEWFRVEGPVAVFVETMRGVGMEGSIPDWSELHFSNSAEKRAAAGRKRGEKLRAKWADPEYREMRLQQNERYRAAAIRLVSSKAA
jgi:hypothetical protein